LNVVPQAARAGVIELAAYGDFAVTKLLQHPIQELTGEMNRVSHFARPDSDPIR